MRSGSTLDGSLCTVNRCYVNKKYFHACDNQINHSDHYFFHKKKKIDFHSENTNNAVSAIAKILNFGNPFSRCIHGTVHQHLRVNFQTEI